jgi:hypothetical protein
MSADLRQPSASWFWAATDPRRGLPLLARPDHYAKVVLEIRRDFARRHSPAARLQDLIQIIEN